MNMEKTDELLLHVKKLVAEANNAEDWNILMLEATPQNYMKYQEQVVQKYAAIYARELLSKYWYEHSRETAASVDRLEFNMWLEANEKLLSK